MARRRSLPRLFAVIGAVVCTLVLAGFGAAHLSLATGRLERMAEAGNTALCSALATLLHRDYGAWLSAVAGKNPSEIAADPEIPALRAAIAAMMADTNVVKVKIYDARGIAVFSTDAKQIGEDKSGNAGFQAALAGRVASIIVHRDRFDAFEQTIEDRDLISSYVPFRTGTGTGTGIGAGDRRGVFEIYSDITAFKQELTRAITFEALLLLVCFGAIYGALLYTVIAGDRASARQHAKSVELAASVARAEAASEQKSQFLATMSHELRTPLNAIIGFSEVMAKGLFGAIRPARYQGYADDILSSGMHLLGLVSDILEFSKGEFGKFTFDIAPVDVAATIGESVDMVQARAVAAGLTLQVEIDPGLGAIATDRMRLKQILINLLSNAVKFTPKGGHVSVRAVRGADGATAAFVIADTGIGIAPSDLPTCLAPFGQVENAHARQHGGTGLGLPLSRKFAELLGGRLEIESALGKGTTVTVHLPLGGPRTAAVDIAA